MWRLIFAAVCAAILLAPAQGLAATAKQKKETCTNGADDQKITGAARKKFLSNCMANRDSPRGKPVETPKQQ
jgi:hypothetical protein